MSTEKYSVQILWSDEDGAFLASVFELPGCMADGATREEALKNINVVIQDWIETAKSLRRPVPNPMTREQIEASIQQNTEEYQRQMEALVEKSIRDFPAFLKERQDLRKPFKPRLTPMPLRSRQLEHQKD
jgi:predicted RNase H-like HicB family nuclease